MSLTRNHVDAQHPDRRLIIAGHEVVIGIRPAAHPWLDLWCGVVVAGPYSDIETDTFPVPTRAYQAVEQALCQRLCRPSWMFNSEHRYVG